MHASIPFVLPRDVQILQQAHTLRCLILPRQQQIHSHAGRDKQTTGHKSPKISQNFKKSYIIFQTKS
jgi:hypothetical protein